MATVCHPLKDQSRSLSRQTETLPDAEQTAEEAVEGVNLACGAWEVDMASKPIPQGSLVLLWTGEDPAVHAALLEELEAAEIRFADKSFGDDEVAPTADPLPIDWKPRFGFEVAVLSPDLTAAQEILEKLLEEEAGGIEISPQGQGG